VEEGGGVPSQSDTNGCESEGSHSSMLVFLSRRGTEGRRGHSPLHPPNGGYRGEKRGLQFTSERGGAGLREGEKLPSIGCPFGASSSSGVRRKRTGRPFGTDAHKSLRHLGRRVGEGGGRPTVTINLHKKNLQWKEEKKGFRLFGNSKKKNR